MVGILFGNLKELPKPVGKYTVGITQLDFTDKSRKKVFPFEEDNTFREIPVTIFYPAESNGGKDRAPYSSPELLEVLSKITFRLFSKNVTKIKTNCYRNALISSSKDQYPVILLIFFEKYLVGNQEIELKDLKYDGVEFRQKLNNKQTI